MATCARETRQNRTAPAAVPAAQSLTRGLRLLELIAESHGSVALTELAQQAGLPTHRLLTTMQQRDLCIRWATSVYGPLALMPLWSAAVFCRAAICWRLCTILRRLMEEAGETGGAGSQ